MGNTCTPVADAYWCMAKPIQYCKVNNNNNKEKKITLIIIESLNDSLLHIIGVPIEEN